MKIVTIGKGNIGGGLGKLWRNAGHDVTELGREGGDHAATTKPDPSRALPTECGARPRRKRAEREWAELVSAQTM